MTDFVQAISCAAGALRVLRRHPSLLLVALALGGLTAADYWLTRRYVTLPQVQDRSPGKRDISQRAPLSRPLYEYMAPALLAAPQPAPSLSCNGTISAIYSKFGERPHSPDLPVPGDGGGPKRPPVYLAPMAVLLSCVVQVLVMGGYMGVASRAAGWEVTPWPRSLRYGRRVFWRLVALGILAEGMKTIAIAPAAVPGALPWAYAAYLLLLPPFFMNLAAFAVVANDAPLRGALRTSIAAIRKHLVTALILIPGAGAMTWATMLPVYASAFRAFPASAGRAQALLLTLVVCYCLVYAISAWYCTAMFIWYQSISGQQMVADRDS